MTLQTEIRFTGWRAVAWDVLGMLLFAILAMLLLPVALLCEVVWRIGWNGETQ